MEETGFAREGGCAEELSLGREGQTARAAALARENAGRDEAALERACELLGRADAVIVAASNGFDIADGYNQFACDDEFQRVFGDLHRAYGLSCILQGLAARWPSGEERWAFLRRLIEYGYRSYEPSPAMRALDALTGGVPRFVVTCNCNGRFVRAGFSSEALYETEGSYAWLRCTAHCSDAAYPVEDFEGLDRSAGEAVDAHAAAHVPSCPRCGSPLDAAVDDTGAITSLEPFASQARRYAEFLAAHETERTVVLELGVGQRNLAIKAPLMRWAERAPRASYVIVNRDAPFLPALPESRAVALRGDLSLVLGELAKRRTR